MKIFFMLLALFNISISLKIRHPLVLALSLITLCLILRFLIIKLSYSWLFFLLVLIFLGGVIVVIIYISSLAANEKSFFAPPIFLLLSPRLISLGLVLDSSQPYKIASSFLFAGDAYRPGFSLILFFCFLLLLFAIVCAVKLIKLEAGPLVKRL